MTRETFYHIVLILGLQIERQDTNMRQAILPDKRVEMVIMKLATLSSLLYIVNQFSVAPCMARVGTCEVCQLLQDITANKFICLEIIRYPKEIIEGFNAM
ncbi:hypothetical protein Y1Q_0007399 [Alligator mississippiensis]|uniref:Uncharacterized protein n=1 Tax=Alligator mississippiensis TaxID=8496 RepID=A0A151P8P4_ALLMI|nr:hypothetical protein Y1Q_0007399 [Alligator mississippiensis]